MDFPTIQQNLNDLPNTFTRPGAPYTQFIDALTAGLFGFTNSFDSMVAEALNFSSAQFGWADVWGAVFNIPRNQNEGTPTYKRRIQNILLANHVSKFAMLYWLQIIDNVNATITENIPNVGYNVSLPGNLTSQQIAQIIIGFAAVRPAGVPFTFNTMAIGTFLDSINFFDAERVTGSYFSQGTSSINLSLTGGTNNSIPLLPDLMLIDPTLNPTLSTPL